MSLLAKTHELKGLQSQLQKEQATEKALKVEVSNAQRKLSQCQDTIKSLTKQIQALQNESPKPIVSEHAILRYLERVHGLDLDEVRAAMMGNGTQEAIAFAKTGKVKKDGVTFVVQNNVVVTVE